MKQFFDNTFKKLSKLFLYRKKLVVPYIDKLLKWLSYLTYAMSALFLVTIVFEHGFILSGNDADLISRVYNSTWYIFVANSLLHIILDFSNTRRKYGRVAWFMTTLLLLTLIPVLFREPLAEGFIQSMWMLFDAPIYKTIVFTVLSFLQLSNGIVLMLGRRINPSFIFTVSFFIIIFIGAGLLMLPKATQPGITLSFVDALFTSTSATCVTGLTSVDVATTFTTTGMFIIMLLIQIGGLGVMTLTSFFAVFFMGNASIYNQTMMCDMVSSKSLNSLLSTLLYILGFTLVIEAIGAVLIFIDIHATLGMDFNHEVGFAIFHSISAFCNAGFSTLPNNLGNASLMSGNHNFFFIVISILIILGGIGFPILVNLASTIRYYIGRLGEQLRMKRLKVGACRVHLYDINTKIATLMTMILVIGGTLVVALLEWNGAFAGLPTLDKLVQSFFTAVCPRTAGFTSFSISSFGIQTILILMVLMAIGGGTQSTAGGIKINVIAVILLNLRAILTGEERVTVLNREISANTVRRSNSTLVLYLIFAATGFFMLTIFEPEASLLALTFESISALSTVGASLDLTPTLATESKYVVIFLMFIGRVGVLTMMTSIIRQHKLKKYKYPDGNIIIN